MGSNPRLFRYMVGRHILHRSAASACQFNEWKPPEGDACWAILFMPVSDDNFNSHQLEVPQSINAVCCGIMHHLDTSGYN